jgi:hypothetical protein
MKLDQNVLDNEHKALLEICAKRDLSATVLELWYDSKKDGGIRSTMRLVEQLSKLFLVRFIDASAKTPQGRREFYERDIPPLAKTGVSVSYSIRGYSERMVMEDFAMNYPVLVVYRDDEAIDVYPHQEHHEYPLTEMTAVSLRGKTPIMQIHEFLNELMHQLNKKHQT